MAEATLDQWRAAVSADLAQLARLHDRELDTALLVALHQTDFPLQLGLRLDDDESAGYVKFMHDTLLELPASPDRTILDDLAADFAAVYLNHSIQASPCESVWLDEDHLMRQQPMFAVREWYQQYNLQAEDWRQRSDDHLVCQLQFLAHLLKVDQQPETLARVTQFLDEHLLLWFKDFAIRVSQRAGTAFYAALGLLTLAYLNKLRTLLIELGH